MSAQRKYFREIRARAMYDDVFRVLRGRGGVVACLRPVECAGTVEVVEWKADCEAHRARYWADVEKSRELARECARRHRAKMKAFMSQSDSVVAQ